MHARLCTATEVAILPAAALPSGRRQNEWPVGRRRSDRYRCLSVTLLTLSAGALATADQVSAQPHPHLFRVLSLWRTPCPVRRCVGLINPLHGVRVMLLHTAGTPFLLSSHTVSPGLPRAVARCRYRLHTESSHNLHATYS